MSSKSEGYRETRVHLKNDLLLRIERLSLPIVINPEDIKNEMNFAESMFIFPGLNVTLGLREIGYVRPGPGSKRWVRTPDTNRLVYDALFKYYLKIADGVTTKPSKKTHPFKAQFSYDFIQCGVKTIHYIIDREYPKVVSQSHIGDEIIDRVSPWIIGDRRKHCISRALAQIGYVKRSRRGKAWEKFDENSEEKCAATLAWIYHHLLEVELRSKMQVTKKMSCQMA